MTAEDLAAYGRELADAVYEALPAWVERSVDRLMRAWRGAVPAEVAEAARVAGQEAQADVGAAVRRLLSLDLDEQRTTPLALIRDGVAYPTRVLLGAGVPPVERDRFVAAAFPADAYDLSPASFADLSPELGELGIRWGAAKAFEHRRRHSS